MVGYRFSAYVGEGNVHPFEQLLKLFKELLIHTSGDVAESLSWLTEIDREHKITTADYGLSLIHI